MLSVPWLALSFSSASAEPVKIGILAFRPKPQMLAQWQPLVVALKRSIPEHDFVIEALTFPEMNAAVANKKLDFVLTNSGHYVLLSHRNGLSSPLATLAIDEQGHVLSVFGGVIFVRAEAAGIVSLSDLKGKLLAATGTESFGGFQTQAYELKLAGINLRKDAKLTFTGMPHDNVVNTVLSGHADAGFVRTGVLEAMVREGKLDMTKVRIINRQEPPGFPMLISTSLYPEWPFVALPHTDENLARHVAAALFLLEENRAVTRALQIHGFAIPANYTPVADLLRELRMPPFDEAPEFTLRDVWDNYRWILIAFLLAAGLISFLAARLLWANRKLAAEQRIQIQQNQELQESESRFRFMLETSPIAVRIASTSIHRVLFANQRYAELIEAKTEDFAGVDPRNYYANQNDYENILATLSKGSSVNNQLIELAIPGGKTKWTLASYMNLKYGNESAVLGWFYDISERKQNEIALRNSETRLNEAQRVAHLGSWELDLTSNKLSWSAEIFNIFEINPDQFKASYEAFLNAIHPDDRDAVNRAYLSSLENRAPYAIDHRLLFSDGRVKYVHECCESEFDQNGKALRSMGTVQDITERKLMEEQMQQLAFYDTLTHLPNRRLLNDRLSQALSASKRSGLYCALMFLDLDNFKPLNDLHGHGVGDLLLIEVASRMKNCVREMDTVARFGGDEFVVMLSELNADKAESAAQAHRVAEKILQSLSAPYRMSIKSEGEANAIVEHHCTASIGVTLFSDHETTIDKVLIRADSAMYKAKEGGRNQIRFEEEV